MRSEIAAARDYLIKYASCAGDDRLTHTISSLLDYLVELEDDVHSRSNDLQTALDDTFRQEELVASLKAQLANADERASKLQQEGNYRTQQLGAIALILSSRMQK